MSPPCSCTSAPSARSASRCRSTGRGPSSQPPGMDSRASPKRARIAPRKITDERSSRMSVCGMKLRLMPRESMQTTSPSRSAVQPRCRRMRSVVSTSRSSGTLNSSVSQPVSTDAAMIGKTAFFAPCTDVLPVSVFPPLMCHILIIFPPHSNFMPYYAKERLFVIFSARKPAPESFPQCGRPRRARRRPSCSAPFRKAAAARPAARAPWRKASRQ